MCIFFTHALFYCKNYITIILLISTCWENYSKEHLFILLLLTYWFLFIFLFTLEPGSQLSEELWHRVQKGTRCHFRVERRPKCTWSSPLPGAFSLKWEALRLSVEEVQGYSASSDLVVTIAVNQEIRWEFVVGMSILNAPDNQGAQPFWWLWAIIRPMLPGQWPDPSMSLNHNSYGPFSSDFITIYNVVIWPSTITSNAEKKQWPKPSKFQRLKKTDKRPIEKDLGEDAHPL